MVIGRSHGTAFALRGHGVSREIDIDRRPGIADAPRVERLRIRADGVPHVVVVGNALLDEVKEHLSKALPTLNSPQIYEYLC